MTDITSKSKKLAALDRKPRHLAVIMDGNGRWARSRMLPRPAGHHAGVDSVRRTLENCGRIGIEVLTLFAFSSENWRRPEDEVSLLMNLFLRTLEKEVARLHENNVRVRLIGDRGRLSDRLRQKITNAEALTANNSGITLVIAASYGGRWDIAQAAQRLAEAVRAGSLEPNQINEDLLSAQINLADLPPPDLLIRTGGERRISNFLLWQLAYAELYFTDTLWPDFGETELFAALDWFAGRERRFGQTSEQIGQTYRA